MEKLRVVHPILFPVSITVIIPMIWLLHRFWLEYTHETFVMITVFVSWIILVVFQMIFTIETFHKRKGSIKICDNALTFEHYAKYLTVGILVITAILFTMDPFVYDVDETDDTNNTNPILESFRQNVPYDEKSGLNVIVLIGFFVTLASIYPRLFLDGNYSRSYFYFKIFDPKDDNESRAYCIKQGLKNYNEFLGVHLDHKIKYIDQVYSNIVLDRFSNQSQKIKTIIEKFEKDNLAPMHYLCKVTGSDENNFLVKKPEYQTVEKWGKIIVPILSILAILVSVYLQLFSKLGE